MDEHLLWSGGERQRASVLQGDSVTQPGLGWTRGIPGERDPPSQAEDPFEVLTGATP